MTRRGLSGTKLSWWTALWFPLVAALLTLSACGDEDTAGKNVISCTNDDPCPVGQVCLRKDGVCGAVACEFCLPGQICYTNASGEQSCSKPECLDNDDCTAPATCTPAGLCKESSCTTRADCPSGQICNLASQCVDPPDECNNDEECPDGQICPESGVCRNGCRTNDQCGQGKFCNPNNACADGCTTSMDCSAEQTCSAENKCVCDNGKCPEGSSCSAETNACVEGAFNCTTNPGSCAPGTYCNGANGMCEPGCTDQPGMPNSCMAGEVCNLATGQCAVDMCVGQDPTQCMNIAQTPYWNPDLCSCVGCINDGQCEAGESCNPNGQCESCDTPCQADQPGTCQGGTPYCLSGCCRECIGSADCMNGQVCVSGTCGAEPDCTVDISVCPQGWTCEMGRCTEPQGMGCDASNPNSCPMGQFCNPGGAGMSGGTCQSLGGGTGMCPLCDPQNGSCNCPGSMTCNGFFCEGCSGFADLDCLGMGGFCLGGICLTIFN